MPDGPHGFTQNVQNIPFRRDSYRDVPASGIEERLFANACSYGESTREFEFASTKMARLNCFGLGKTMAKEAQNKVFFAHQKDREQRHHG
jgi:hypothetical protein